MQDKIIVSPSNIDTDSQTFIPVLLLQACVESSHLFIGTYAGIIS